MTQESKLNTFNLKQFTGSENWYRHGINRNVTFTEGAKFVADEGGAYWLLDTIAICQCHEPKVSAEEFQVWKLKVNADHTAILACEDGKDNVVYVQKIPFTDFPLDEIALFFANGVIHLPSEY